MANTEENLKAALSGESEARAKYMKFAGVANKEGHQAIAKTFQETADNEYEHASIIMSLLGIPSSTADNLKAAASGEMHEWTKMYPDFLEQARKDKNERAVKFFENIVRIEQHHMKRYQLMLERLQKGTLYKSDHEEYWFCTNCGYIHKGKEAPTVCPNCLHAQGYFKRTTDLEYGAIDL